MKYIIDTDPGIDDAIAIMLGYLNHLDIIGFTLATGNIETEKSANNLKTIQNILKSNIKMYKGTVENKADKFSAEYAHGKDGLGNIFMPKSNKKFETKSAEDFIIESAEKYQDNLTIICLGPLTNLASAIKKNKNIVKKIKQVIVMGSTYNPNVNTPYREFNVKIDPKAAEIVFSSGFSDIKIITHDIGIQSFVEKDYINSLKESTKIISKFVYLISQKYMEFSFDHYKVEGLTTPDPITMAYTLNNNVVEFKPCNIKIIGDLSYVNLVSSSNIYISVNFNLELFQDIFKKTFN